MKKSRLIVLCSTLAIAGLVTIAFASKPSHKMDIIQATEEDSSLVVKELSDFGIAGGINIDYRTGLTTQFVAPKKDTKPQLSYMVQRGSFSPNSILRTGRAITEEKLKNAQTVSDVIENYPSNWISDYNSVTVSASINGKIIEATGPDDKLTLKQKKLFKNASSVFLSVQYQKKNNRDQVQNRQMNVSFVVTPKVEAEYIGGYKKMIAYLKENSLDQINAKNFSHRPQPSVSFIIDENGAVEKVKLEETSRDKEIDQLLIKLIQNMPSWKPAVNKGGLQIKQEFVLNIGQDGC